MSITFTCSISLSKKLRGLIKTNAQLTLIVPEIINGKGEGRIILETDRDKDISEKEINEIGETSIILIPEGLVDETPTEAVGNIFSNAQSQSKTRTLVDKIAATEAPEEEEIPDAILTKEEKIVPKVFKQTKNPKYKKFVSSLEELIGEIQKTKNKKIEEVDLSQAKNDREKAILIEMKEKSEGIDVPAWVVNDKNGNISINDLGIGLPLNSPYNLSNVSAKKLAISSDLRSLIKSGHIRFVSPEEKDQIIISGSEEKDEFGLKVFSNHDAAMDAIDNPSDDDSESKTVISEKAYEVKENDMCEEESMILNLTAGAPKNKSSSSTGTRKTTHGNSNTELKNNDKKPVKPLLRLKLD
jgi:hypothetical protein